MSEAAADVALATESKSGPRWDIWLAVALWTPLVVLYVWTIGREPYHPDEYRTLYDIRESIPVLMADRLKAGHQPLYFLTAWLWEKIAGSGTLAVRALPQAACFVAAGFLYGVARQVGGRYAAMLAVTFCLLSEAFLWVSHNARPGAFLAMFVMAATFFIVTAGDKPRIGRQVLIGLMVLLALLSYNAALPVAGVMCVGVLFAGKARWRLLLAVVGAIIIFAPWFAYTMTWVEAKDRLGWIAPGPLVEWPGAIFDFSYNLSLISMALSKRSWALPVVGAAWFLQIAFVIFGFIRAKKFGVLLGLMWFAQLAFGAYNLLVLDMNPMRILRYFTVTAMIQAVGLALAATRLPLPQLMRCGLAAVLIAFATFGLYRKLKEPVNQYDMGLVYYIADNAPNADAVYVLQNSRIRFQLEMHLGRPVHMIPHVYGIAPSFDNRALGVEAVDLGNPMDPMPHEGADELIIVAHASEMDPAPGETRHAATQEIRDKLDELVHAFEVVQIQNVDGNRVYHLRQQKNP